jgi:hypothetical protein
LWFASSGSVQLVLQRIWFGWISHDTDSRFSFQLPQ